MQEIIGGKRYDTETATIIAKCSLYSYSNNYAGTYYIGVTPKGTLFAWVDSNGQDCHITDYITTEIDVDGCVIVDEELALKHKLIEEA
jgi:hypothetical protein